MGRTIDTLNSIRDNGSREYQERIPKATRENIQAIGNALTQYTTLHNEFCDALLNKIGKTILESKLFKNKLARFKSGAILSQQDVEEIFIEMASAEGAYNPAGPNPLGRREYPDIKTIYHRMNRQDYYAISIGDVDFRRVFRSEDTLDTFISGLINSVYSGASYDEWLAMKNLLVTYDGYKIALLDKALTDIEDDAGKKTYCKDLAKTIRKLVTDMSFPTRDYNKAGVRTWSDPSELVLFLNKDAVAEMDVELYAQTFNLGNTNIKTEIVLMDDLTEDAGEGNTFKDWYDYTDDLTGEGKQCKPVAILADKDFLRVYDTLSHFEPQRNAQGLFTNYFYHVHQILSLSNFKQAVMIAEPYV